MHAHHATIEEQQTAREPSMWSRAFEEMRRVRNTEQSPDPDVFRDLTKSAGGD